MSRAKDDVRPCGRGTGTKLRIVYVPRPRPILVKQLAPQADYAVDLFDPVAGGTLSLGKIRTDENGTWQGPSPAGNTTGRLFWREQGEPGER